MFLFACDALRSAVATLPVQFLIGQILPQSSFLSVPVHRLFVFLSNVSALFLPSYNYLSLGHDE